MLKASTIQLLRFPFSFFLMPVYWLALLCTENIAAMPAALIFLILHGFIYPASNGYNSYMDRDTDSIGGIEMPPQPTNELFVVSLSMDVIGLLLCFLVSKEFVCGILIFIIASRLYSYRGIRLKRFPLLSYLIVILCQGALIFFLVSMNATFPAKGNIPWRGMVAASLLVGGFYPLTQIYQHMQDKKDGVVTLSYILGYRGTFVFSGLVYLSAMSFLFMEFISQDKQNIFYLIQFIQLPVLYYFLEWFYKVWRDKRNANFKHSMRMNVVASVCSNASFIAALLIDEF